MAHEFADLHDRAGRMKAKGVIRDIVTWPRSRAYFHWRARRRIAEDGLVRQFQVRPCLGLGICSSQGLDVG